MNKENLKPFDLEKAKAGAKVVTRDGREVRIICFDRKAPVFKLVALINNKGIEDETNILY